MIENGVTPTMRDICNGIGLSSTSSVHVYFKRLVIRGEIIQMDKATTRYRVKGMRYVREGH